jgi:hypothetical protein
VDLQQFGIHKAKRILHEAIAWPAVKQQSEFDPACIHKLVSDVNHGS